MAQDVNSPDYTIGVIGTVEVEERQGKHGGDRAAQLTLLVGADTDGVEGVSNLLPRFLAFGGRLPPITGGKRLAVAVLAEQAERLGALRIDAARQRVEDVVVGLLVGWAHDARAFE